MNTTNIRVIFLKSHIIGNVERDTKMTLGKNSHKLQRLYVSKPLSPTGVSKNPVEDWQAARSCFFRLNSQTELRFSIFTKTNFE